jgi:protein gp37
MSLDGSGISWTEGTLNSLYGCRECSAGCRLCFAVGRIHRFSANLKKVNADGRFNKLVKERMKEDRRCFTGTLLFDAAHLYAVLGDRKPKKLFVNEFSDLFFEALPIEIIIEHFKVFKAAQWHVYQALTKRDERLAEVNQAILAEFGEWPTNVWMGVSVCSAAEIEMKRIDRLGAKGASLKWVSFEPWISDVNRSLSESAPDLRNRLKRNQISWVIVGGEKRRQESDKHHDARRCPLYLEPG